MLLKSRARSTRSLVFTSVAFSSMLLVGCGDGQSPVSPEAAALDHEGHTLAAAVTPADYQKKLASLRRATARFHNFEAAQDAGYTLQFTPCIAGSAGGMGFHYVNDALKDDPAVYWDQPEALLYEPDASGRMRLVAVEYIVEFEDHPANQLPGPSLDGLPFSPSPAFGVWGLHAWVWRENPEGMHKPFNPLVSCDDA